MLNAHLYYLFDRIREVHEAEFKVVNAKGKDSFFRLVKLRISRFALIKAYEQLQLVKKDDLKIKLACNREYETVNGISCP